MALFEGRLGQAVGLDSEEAMGKMQTLTALMGPYFGILKSTSDWLSSQGVDPDTAAAFAGSLLHSVALDGKEAALVGGSQVFEKLIAEQTPGGYNEQALRELAERGVFQAFGHTLTSVNRRWEGSARGEKLPTCLQKEARRGGDVEEEEEEQPPKESMRKSRSTATEEDVVVAEGFKKRRQSLDGQLERVGVDPIRLDTDPVLRGSPALRHRSFVLPKSLAAAAIANTPSRAETVAAQIAFMIREAEADAAEWLRNVDDASREKSQKQNMEQQWVQSLPLVVILDGLRSAANVGTIFRTAEAAGVSGVVTCGTTPRPPDKAVLKTAVKSAEYVPHRHLPSAMKALQEFRAQGYEIWGVETTSKSELYTDCSDMPDIAAAVSLSDAAANSMSTGLCVGGEAKDTKEGSCPRKLAVIFGNELVGVTPGVLEECDRIVEIPTFGVKNSLNVAVAASVVIYELVRAWGLRPKRHMTTNHRADIRSRDLRSGSRQR